MKTFKDIPFELDNGCVKGQLIFENNFSWLSIDAGMEVLL